MIELSQKINQIVWGTPLLILLLGTGIFLSFRLKFFQLTKFSHWQKSTLFSLFKKETISTQNSEKSLSRFQAIATSLAGTIGTGNIIGVASAISIGGAGSVFWMWFSAFFGMITKFAENTLGIFYRRKNQNGEWSGGAMYYLEKSVSNKRISKALAISFSFFTIIASFGIGNMMQCNVISQTAKTFYPSPKTDLIVGIILFTVTFLSLIGGIKRIGKITEKLVPFMAIAYILGCLFIIFSNINTLPNVLSHIFKGAFGIDAALGGGIGTLISKTISIGIKRGVFSNEAGLGSSVSVNAAANTKEPVEQGMWGIFEVFFDTFVICSLTAFAILSSNTPTNVDSTTLVLNAFSSSMGSFASAFISISTLCFAFATVLGWSQYGLKAAEYLFGIKASNIYKFIFSVFTIVGATSSLSLIWEISDTFNALMAIPNLIGLLLLSKTTLQITQNYIDRKFKNKKIPPLYSFYSCRK